MSDNAIKFLAVLSVLLFLLVGYGLWNMHQHSLIDHIGDKGCVTFKNC